MERTAHLRHSLVLRADRDCRRRRCVPGVTCPAGSQGPRLRAGGDRAAQPGSGDRQLVRSKGVAREDSGQAGLERGASGDRRSALRGEKLAHSPTWAGGAERRRGSARANHRRGSSRRAAAQPEGRRRSNGVRGKLTPPPVLQPIRCVAILAWLIPVLGRASEEGYEQRLEKWGLELQSRERDPDPQGKRVGQILVSS